MIATPDPIIGSGLAFLSHFLLDYLGESSYKDLKEAAIVEGCLLMVFVSASIASSYGWLMMLGWFMSNLPDLIDKPLRIFLGLPEWFSCHNGKGLFQISGKKLGYPTIVRLGYWETILINVASTIILALFVVYEKSL